MIHLRSAFVLFALLWLVTPLRADTAISAGIPSVRSGGNPASLVVWGDATPLIVREDGRVMAASATLGAGRVVALGHGGYFGVDHNDTLTFLGRAIRWLGAGADILTVHGLSTHQMEDLGIACQITQGHIGTLDLSEVDVVIGSPQAWASAGRLDDLRRFVEQGGGLLAGECAWGQLQLGRADSVETLAANRMLMGAGIMYTDRAEPGESVHVASRADHANASAALRALGEGRDVGFASRVVGEALRTAPIDSVIMREARAMRRSNAESIEAAYAAMGDTPITPESHPLAYALLEYDARTWDSVRAPHPSHVAFPGPHSPDARAGVRTASIDTAVPGWHSTGLWAPAGEDIRVRPAGDRPHDAPLEGLTLQIGCWLDPQDFAQRVRFPAGVTTARSAPQGTLGRSPIGGPVYIVVPPGTARGVVDVAIDGAIEMPRFVLGETTLEAWNAMMDDPAAPWCELESEELVFTLPVDMVKQCERPDLVMEHWDRVHRAMHSLQPRSPNHWPDGKYRYVAERRLSWGYMYCPANAPIVIPMSAADEMVDLDQYDAEGPHQLWGHYHEMGHAHQSGAWTFDGTGEVTVNIFTVYALHTVNGYPLDSEHLRTSPDEAWQRFERHKAEGAPFEKWKRDPFLALQTYAMLWHEFGFEMYESVFENYREAGFIASRMSEQEKIDRWAIECSFATQRDLVGYFRAWGLPVSGEAERIIPAAYPDWMPQAPE
ncbi:MAG: hypothetical protein Tsb0013_19010 [Phycisphaerales bacterium]